MDDMDIKKKEESKQETQEEILTLPLWDPYTFEGEEIKEIKLDGMMDLTAGDLCDIDRQMNRMGYSGGNLEVTRQYAMLTAAKVNQKPWEYCNGMKARDSIRLKNVVTTFFYIRG